MGQSVKWLEEEAAIGNEVAAKVLASRPKVPAHLHSVWKAFTTLDPDRAIGFGTIGAIPFTAIDRYASRYGINTPDDFDRFLFLINAMDTAFRAVANKASKGSGGQT